MLNRLKTFFAPPVYEDEDTNRKAQLLNVVLLAIIALLILLLAARLVTDVTQLGSRTATILGSLILFVLGVYITSRYQYLRLSTYALVSGTWLAITFLAWSNDGVKDTAFIGYIVIILVASVLSGWRTAVLFIGLSIGAGWGFVYAESVGLIATPEFDPSSDIMTDYMHLFGLIGVMIYLLVDGLQKALDGARESNHSLQLLSQQLEKRVEDRTRDLNLAADIGRGISQVRELDKLLQNAVNTIQERFNLYYVQIYLADNKQRFLSLKSGTGIVGQQLVRRGHSLPFGGGSINGTAAAEKRPVLVADTAASPFFKPNSLLPYTRSEMAVPLLVGEKVVGVLNLQSDQPNGLSQDNLAAFETLAGQFAIAIENANLFAETIAARSEIEVYLQRVTREGWDNYQDAINRPAALGMVYENGKIRQVAATESFGAGVNGLRVPIAVANELVGSIQLEPDDGHEWTEEEKELISTVAWQIGQQAESLRLLTETERYRAEAEQAARRLSGEAWQEFLREKQAQVNQGFVFTDNMVNPLSEDSLPDDTEAVSVRQPLKIHNESIGELSVSGVNQDEAQVLLASVSNQLSRHIENIRLVEQTESALGQAESLYQIGHELNTATNVDEILHAALGPIFPTGIDEATLMFIELDREGTPQTLELLAGWRMDGNLSFPVGTVFPMARFPFTSLFINEPDDPQLIGDAATDPRVDDFTRGVMAHAGIKAIAVIPLTMGGQWVGIITCSWPQSRTFSRQEEEIFNALINMAAPAVQSQRLFFKTKAQADKEHLINEINERIQRTVSVESALQTAVKELGQALQTKTLVKLNMGAEKQPHNYKDAEAISAD